MGQFRAIVDKLSEAGEFKRGLEEAEALLLGLEASGASGPGLVSIRAKTNGLKGVCLLRLGLLDEAREATARALEDCERIGDEEGIRAYRANLAHLDAHAPERHELIDAEIEVLEAFSRAQSLTDLGRFEASNRVLSGLLERDGNAARFVEVIRPHILGRMGFNEFKLGDRDAARSLTRSARDLCSDRGDALSAEVYDENLLAIGPEAPAASDAGPPPQSSSRGA